MHVGYAGADKYECAHCGAQVGTMKGVSLLPNLGVNIAYNLKRREQREKKKEEILEIVAPVKDTLVPPAKVQEPDSSEDNGPVQEDPPASDILEYLKAYRK